MANLGKEIENDKKWNEKKLGPCLNVFLTFDPYTTLDLFHPKQFEWDSRGSVMTNHKKLIDVTVSLDRKCPSFTKEMVYY